LVVTTCKGTWSFEAALIFLFLLPSLFYVINNITKSVVINILIVLNCNLQSWLQPQCKGFRGLCNGIIITIVATFDCICLHFSVMLRFAT
jgi:hypothetical protein